VNRPTFPIPQRHYAACLEFGCDFHVDGTRNGLGLAAQHYDRTGHAVRVETCRVVYYGRPPGRADSDGMGVIEGQEALPC